MIKEFRKNQLYDIYEIDGNKGRLKSFNNDEKIALIVFDISRDWFEKEWEYIEYSKINFSY